MSKVHSAFKCDCCGALYEGARDDGVCLIIQGHRNWSSLCKEKYEFPDICGTCRDAFRVAIRDVAKARGWCGDLTNPTSEPAGESDGTE